MPPPTWLTALGTPHPPGISNPFYAGDYGYFLELHIQVRQVSKMKKMTKYTIQVKCTQIIQ